MEGWFRIPHQQLDNFALCTRQNTISCEKQDTHITLNAWIKTPDSPKWVNFCDWLLKFVRHLLNILDTVYFSDETWFTFNEFINAQNYRFWSSKNLHTHRDADLYPWKIGVVVAMSQKWISGPIFFESTIKGKVYRDIIYRFVALSEKNKRDVWFQQDNSRPHIVVVTQKPMCQIMCFSLYCVNGSIKGRHID